LGGGTARAGQSGDQDSRSIGAIRRLSSAGLQDTGSARLVFSTIQEFSEGQFAAAGICDQGGARGQPPAGQLFNGHALRKLGEPRCAVRRKRKPNPPDTKSWRSRASHRGLACASVSLQRIALLCPSQIVTRSMSHPSEAPFQLPGRSTPANQRPDGGCIWMTPTGHDQAHYCPPISGMGRYCCKSLFGVTNENSQSR
jgi:hypothetical protein